MPHIYAKYISKVLELPLKRDNFIVYDRFVNERAELFFVSQDGVDFALTLRRKNNRYLIKYDKATRPASTFILTKALSNLAIALECEVENSNLALVQKKESEVSPWLLKPNFFEKNPTFLDGKQAELEVGFGSGRHLSAIAQEFKEKIFFGIEIYKPAALQLLGRIERENMPNIFVVDFDARLFLQTLPSDSLDKIHIHFPVPWNDSPHRRVFVKKFIDEAFRVLKPNGTLELRSDDEVYFKDACGLILEYKTSNFHVFKNRQILVSSKYEDRWKKQGKDIYDLIITAVKKQNDDKIECNFDFENAMDISIAEQICSLPAIVFDGIVVRFEDAFKSESGAFIIKIILGSVDMPESKYIYTRDGISSFYPTKPLPIRDNMIAFKKLKEKLYGKSN